MIQREKLRWAMTASSDTERAFISSVPRLLAYYSAGDSTHFRLSVLSHLPMYRTHVMK